jgi:hypothetical protein
MRRAGWLAVGLWALLAPAIAAAQPGAGVGQQPACPSGNLMAGARLRHASEVPGQIARVTDGVIAPEGAVWDASPAVVLATGAATITWDLGQVTTLRAAWLQADGNDRYTLWGSLDGERWSQLARAEVLNDLHGLRGRKLALGGGAARYLRLGEAQGDSFYSVSELQAFCELPSPFPPALRLEAAPVTEVTKGLSAYWNNETSARWELVLALLGLALLQWGHHLRQTGRAEHRRKLRDRLLAWGGLVAALTYFNFGAFHFGNTLHDWEWTHYYLGSKYFQELSYDRLYECIAVADVEDGLRRRVELRKVTNLRTNVLESSAGIVERPDLCKQHFSSGRWEKFKHDVRFFRERQIPKRWDDLQTDHGYNGTPVWNIAGSLLANTAPASKAQIYLLALLDPLYLAGTVAVVWWAFGWRVLSVALLVFATNFPSRFYWTGGAYLRWDWIFFTVAAICCLRKERPLLAGAALAHATLLRIFPAFIFAGPALGLAWVVIKQRRLDRRYARFFLGAALATALLVPLSLAISGGPSAYQRFVQNTIKHKETPLTNYMGLRTVLAWRPDEVGRLLKDEKLTDPWINWKQARLDAAREARPITVLVMLGFLVLLGLATRQGEPWMAAALGVTFIPLGAELTSYYYAFIIGVALLHQKREEVGRWLLLLTAFTQFVAWAPLPRMARWLDEQYTLMSAATLVAFGFIVWVFREPAAEPATVEPLPEEGSTAISRRATTAGSIRSGSRKNRNRRGRGR